MKPSNSTPTRAVVALSLAHNVCELVRDKGAHGRAFLGRQYAGFANEFGIELEGDVGLHFSTHVDKCSTILRA
jgi:hypothetical protein